MTIIQTLLLHSLINLLMLGSVAGLILGAILILKPNWLVRASLVNNRWIPTRHIDKILERPINIDAWFHRYFRIGSLLAAAGAIYILYYFSVVMDKTSAVSSLAASFHMTAAYIGLLFEPMVLIAQLGAAFALFVSLFVLVRPTLFRRFEGGANEWFSLRRTMKPLEIQRNSVDEYTFSHTTPIGVLLVMGSVYTLVLFTFWAR